MPKSKEKGHVIGVDLGTFSSSAAYVNRQGDPVTIPIDGKPKMPTVIFMKEDGGVLVGTAARAAALKDPSRAASRFKNDLGQRHFREEVAGKTYSPQLLVAIVMHKLKREAEKVLGKVAGAVVAVPAFANERMRQAVVAAGQMAELPVVDIISAPTCAALTYALPRLLHDGVVIPPDQRSDGTLIRHPRMLVFHLGAGTFDTMAIKVDGSVISTMSADGDVDFGGFAWDDRLIDMLASKFRDNHNIDPLEHPAGREQLRSVAAAAKAKLSSHDAIKFGVRFNGAEEHFELTRKAFDELTADLLFRVERRVSRVMLEAGVQKNDLDRVLVVGHAAQMLPVMDMLRKLTGREPDTSLIDEENVARGAATHGAMTAVKRAATDLAHAVDDNREIDEDMAEMGLWAPFEEAPLDVLFALKINNISTHSLGIALKGHNGIEHVNSVLIPRHSPLPKDVLQRFPTVVENQQRVRVILVEGESKDAAECIPLGAWEITLPPGLPKGAPIDVRVSYDTSQRLELNVIDATSLSTKKVSIKRDIVSPPEMIERARAVLKRTPIE